MKLTDLLSEQTLKKVFEQFHDAYARGYMAAPPSVSDGVWNLPLDGPPTS